MDRNTQMHMHAIVQGLITDDGDTFDAAKATELLDMLAPEAPKSTRLTMSVNTSSSSTEGLTSTGHSASIDSEGEKKIVIDTRPRGTWVGRLSVRRVRSTKDSRHEWIEIADRFFDTRSDFEPGPAEFWVVNFHAGIPNGLSQVERVIPFWATFIPIPGLHISKLVHRTWKRPR
jgi:hypothetical protein